MDAYYREYRASIHRGVYPLAALATEAYEGARDKVAAFAGSAPGETVFTRNATEAINLVAYAGAGRTSRAGDLIVVTEMEHHSNLVPWQLLCERTGAELAYVPIDDEGLLDLDALDALLARGPKLVAVAHVSNVLGTVNPVAEIAAPRARRRRGRRSSTARRPRRTCRSTCTRSTPTSTPGPPTRPTARRASACCTAAASCSRRCRRSSAAGT